MRSWGTAASDSHRCSALAPPARMPVDRLMSGKLALDEINKGFDRLHEGMAARQVAVF